MGICDGRVVIVTGAARGLGRAHALAFAAEGAAVVVNDLGVERDGSGGTSDAALRVVGEMEAAGGRAVASAADVADWDQAAAMVRLAIDSFGSLDTLVLNAASCATGCWLACPKTSGIRSPGFISRAISRPADEGASRPRTAHRATPAS